MTDRQAKQLTLESLNPDLLSKARAAWKRVYEMPDQMTPGYDEAMSQASMAEGALSQRRQEEIDKRLGREQYDEDSSIFARLEYGWKKYGKRHGDDMMSDEALEDFDALIEEFDAVEDFEPR
jgi:hypothetical protein